MKLRKLEHRSYRLVTGILLAGVLSIPCAVRAEEPDPAKAEELTEPGEPNLAEQVLDVQGLSKLSLEQLMDLPVITASGKAEERSLAAANVFIVTRNDIERHGYRSLGELLRRVPGLYLVNDYVNQSVGVREVTGGYRGGTRIVKIMIDGFPISFRPDLEAFLGPEFIPIEAVERVEVAKGPLSALYGANAFLATVNVITREPENREVEVAGRYAIVNGNPGGGISAVASHAGIDTSVLLAASFDRLDRSGVQAQQTFEYQDLRNPALSRPSKDDVAAPVSAFGRFDYHHDDAGDFRVEGGYQELDAKAEFQLNSLVTHRSRVNVVNGWGALHWAHHVGRLNLRAYIGAAHGAPTDDYQLFLTGTLGRSFKPNFGYDAFNALAEASYDFGPWLQSDIGVDMELRREDVLYYTQVFYKEGSRDPFEEQPLIRPNEARDYHYRQLGAYVQLHSAPLENVPDFRLTGAARADWIDFGPVTYSAQTSFRGAVAHRFSPLLTTKLIGGRAFQTPSGTLLYAHGGFGNSLNVQGTERLDNPRGLRPQVVTSAEVVALSQVADFLTLEASGFYQELTDAIRFNQAGQLIVAKNSRNVETVGGELLANLHFGRFRPYAALSVSKQLSATLTREESGITSFSGSPSMFPRFFGYAGCDVELLHARLFLNAELWWAGPRGASQANFYRNDSRVYSLPSYQLLDVTLSTGSLPLLDRELGTRLLVSARNAFATDYQEPGFAGVDIPQPETTLLFQVRQTL